MDQEGVLKRLATQCDQFQVPHGTWIIFTKGEPHKGVGKVFFESGKLVVISKDWSDALDAPEDVVDAIYFAAKHFESEGRTDCKIYAILNDEPQFTMRRVSVLCGRKEILVSASHFPLPGTKEGKIVSVEEVLR